MITVVGSLNYDFFVYLDRFPKPGETVKTDQLHTACGGKGANQAYAAARLSNTGTRVRMIGAVGDDNTASVIVDNLSAIGIDVSGVARRSGVSSGTAFITLNTEGQNEIVIVLGANATLGEADVLANPVAFAQASAVICQLETTLAATEAALRAGRAAGALTVLNPAPYAPFPDALLGLADLIAPNETEASALTGVHVTDPDSAAQAAAMLRLRGARDVIVTLGSQGAWVDTRAWRGLMPAPQVRALDPTAAGDTFIGGLVARLVEGADMREAARFACAAAAISVTRPGAQPSIPSRAEVDALL
jgi:ribokinase